eukprot:scaffold33384_cov122-Amphora_coffeaeformis.AAC.1
MQDRWHRRYAKFGTAGRPHFRKHGGRRGGPFGPRGFGPRAFPPPFAPHGPPHGPPHFPPPPHGPPHFPPCGPPPHFPPPPHHHPHGPPHHEPNMEEVDAALKEAIRRSMEDVKEAQTQTEVKQTSTEAVQTDPKPDTQAEAEPEDKKTSGWPKELIKAQATKWKCDCCRVLNEEHLDACAACTVLRGGSGEPEIIVEPATGLAPVLVTPSAATPAALISESSKSSSG